MSLDVSLHQVWLQFWKDFWQKGLSLLSGFSSYFKSFCKQVEIDQFQCVLINENDNPITPFWYGNPLPNSKDVYNLYYGLSTLEVKKLTIKNDLLIINCEKCRSLLEFKFQLMPACLTYLKLEKNSKISSLGEHAIEFATIVVYSCIECIADEVVIVQYERLS